MSTQPELLLDEYGDPLPYFDDIGNLNYKGYIIPPEKQIFPTFKEDAGQLYYDLYMNRRLAFGDIMWHMNPHHNPFDMNIEDLYNLYVDRLDRTLSFIQPYLAEGILKVKIREIVPQDPYLLWLEKWINYIPQYKTEEIPVLVVTRILYDDPVKNHEAIRDIHDTVLWAIEHFKALDMKLFDNPSMTLSQKYSCLPVAQNGTYDYLITHSELYTGIYDLTLLTRWSKAEYEIDGLVSDLIYFCHMDDEFYY